MPHTVYVDGQEGTTGLRIHDMLAQRDDLQVLHIDASRRKDPAERARLLNAADVAFLCLPDAASIEAAAMVSNARTCLIDASTAHRTADGWTYGLPELAPGQRDRIRKAKRISNPGCHATAFILLLRPLVDAGWIAPAAAISATSLTGYSGGGKAMIAQYSAATGAEAALLQAPRPYALTQQHKHLPEMRLQTGLHTPPVFQPVVGPFYNGLVVSVPLHTSQLQLGANLEALHATLLAHYLGESFVQVRPPNDPATLESLFFDVQACNGTNRAELFLFGNDAQMVLMARLDNLGKGASGAAVQSMNLHLGLQEDFGLVR